MNATPVVILHYLPTVILSIAKNLSSSSPLKSAPVPAEGPPPYLYRISTVSPVSKLHKL
jgi:hypothetical protein